MSKPAQKQSLEIHRIELPTGFAVGPVNSFVIIAENQRILVDCGPKHDMVKRALLMGLHNLGLSIEDITGLVLTHGHVDHVGLTSLFQSHGIPVYAHPDVASWLAPESAGDKYRLDFYQHFYPKMGMPKEDIERSMEEYLSYRKLNDRSVVDVPLIPNQVFPPLPQFRVLAVPGHAQAAIALWEPGEGKLIVGDQVLPHISSNALIEPVPGAASGVDAKRTMSLLQYRENMQQLSELPIKVVYPGHGETFTEVHELLRRRLEEQEKRRFKVEELLRTHGPMSAYQLATLYFPKHRNQASLILSEILGYLDWLAIDGKAEEVENGDGIFIWQVC